MRAFFGAQFWTLLIYFCEKCCLFSIIGVVSFNESAKSVL